MHSDFYLKLALRNIRANKQLYIPYAISAVLTVAMFFQMVSLTSNGFITIRGGDSLLMLFNFGTIVIAVFSFVFILYTNSFLIKRRKKEMGLYGILGLEKRHVARILLVESTLVGVGSILAGLVVGTIFGRLFFLLLNYLLQLPTAINYSLQGSHFLMTVALFAAIFLVAYLYNISQVTFSNPILLLRGEKEGEREPKSNLFLFLLGLTFLGAGYWLSVTIADPLAAMLNFFWAVLLVIVGTYLLFTAGSIYILKALKKNKKLYYQPRAFISISGMLYRMKQHAIGLANISILACMVIIAVGTTLTLYIAAEEGVAFRYPAENNATVYYDEEKTISAIESDMDLVVAAITSEEGPLEVQTLERYSFANVFGKLDGENFKAGYDEAGGLPQTLIMVAVDDFNRLEKTDLALGKNQVYLHDSSDYVNSSIQLADLEFQVQRFTGQVEKFLVEESFGQSLLVVMPGQADIDAVLQSYLADSEDSPLSVTGSIHWNTTGTDEEKRVYAEKLRPSIEVAAIVNYETLADGKTEWYTMNGGFLFLGLFLGMLFTLGTILITYFKQISEGYDDRGRFQMMQKVGLDKDLIRDTSRSQVVWMFMLPLLVATIHTIFAYPIIYKLLILFGILSHKVLILSLGGVVVVFSLVYGLIYRLTANMYYAIVQ